MGPALIASVAYMDPGNFATNIQAGASQGYRLLWVVLTANLVAMQFQALSAKLGIVTGQGLAELSRAHFPRSAVWAMWIVAEIGAMATDLAEFLGASIAMMVTAAAVFHDGTHDGIADIETAYRALGPLLGHMAAAIFLVSLLASGLSSSVVGTLAGQVVMQGFVGWRIPLWLRRLVTMAPAVVIAALGVNPTTTLVLSQVVLSLVLPVPMLTLILFTSRPDIMGGVANRPVVAGAAALAAAVILGLNVVLLLETCGAARPLA